VASVQKKLSSGVFATASILTRFGNEELVMDSFGYSRCSQCDEEYFLQDGSRCARCLGLDNLPIDDENTEQESSSIFLEQAA
jgi:hypothetical protein